MSVLFYRLVVLFFGAFGGVFSPCRERLSFVDQERQDLVRQVAGRGMSGIAVLEPLGSFDHVHNQHIPPSIVPTHNLDIRCHSMILPLVVLVGR